MINNFGSGCHRTPWILLLSFLSSISLATAFCLSRVGQAGLSHFYNNNIAPGRKIHNNTPIRVSNSSDQNRGFTTRDERKALLLDLITSVTSNQATPKKLTVEILSAVKNLEELCPTDDNDVLEELGGNWELIWTAQDKSSPEGRQIPLSNWINPLENQSYSNNPEGRSNPILPQNIQNSLEDLGIIKEQSSDSPVRSSQAIDLKNNRVRNVVTFEAKNPLPISLPFLPEKTAKGLLTVDVKFSPNLSDVRRVDVKFEACRLTVRDSPVDINFPLGAVGPTGWLRTGYIDENMRITRGHKGSVFILSRASRKKSK